MSDVRTFRADSLKSALDLVREELGRDAVILHTRHLSERSLMPWKNRQQVEIAAKPAVPTPQRRRPETVPDKQILQSAAAEVTTARESTTAQPNLDAVISPKNSNAEVTSSTEEKPVEKRPKPIAARPTPKLVTPLAIAARNADPPPISRHRASSAKDAFPSFAGVDERLTAIERALEDIRSEVMHRTANRFPEELDDLFHKLLDAAVDEPTACELLSQLRRQMAPEQWRDLQVREGLVKGLIARHIPCGDPIYAAPGKRRVVALVGATGVGKTTTLAKLAANFRLRGDAQIGLITIDTYRISAVEQLRAYAEMIDVPLKVVSRPTDMQLALDELSGAHLVLIDTGGRSPYDVHKMQDLQQLLAVAHPDEVHLVLSLTTELKELASAAKSFAVARPTSAIVTKLDEASRLGGILTLCRQANLPLSYVTTGQEVPQDIEPAHPDRLADLILKGQPHTAALHCAE